MKLAFASLLCHRDVQIFKFNWFTSRINIDHGFDIPHLILNDGSLTPQDIEELNKLPHLVIDPDPIVLYPNIPNPILVAKLQCFERGFGVYNYDRVIIIDADIFFYKSWDFIIKRILMSKAICLKDWGSSLGPNPVRYKEIFGVTEDAITPNCNTGIYSIPKEEYHRIPPIIKRHIEEPYQIMEDQGIFFAAFYGDIEYIKEIQCLVNGIEDYDYAWNHILTEKHGAHLQGMRVRTKALNYLLNYSVDCCPKEISLEQIKPVKKEIREGLLSFGGYDYTKPWQEFPTQYNGKYVLNGMYMHAGSCVEWVLPENCYLFKTKYICMHTGKPDQCHPVNINGKYFKLNEDIEIELKGSLKIKTEYSEGGHICFLKPALKIKLEAPIIS